MAFRVVTLRLPQLIRIGIITLGILIAGLLIFTLFGPKNASSAPGAALYQPGLYTSSVQFGTQAVCVQVIMNETGIQSVSYQIPEEISSVYPLLTATSSMIEKQVLAGGDPSAIQPDSNAQDTASYLIKAIQAAKAKSLKSTVQ